MQPIDDPADPRLAPYRDLKDRQLRRRGQFITEGRFLTRRLLAADAASSVWLSDRIAADFAPEVPAEVPCYVSPETLIAGVTGYPFHRGVLGCGIRPELPTLRDWLPDAMLRPHLTLVVLPEVNDPENLGAIFRAASAFDIDAVVVGPRCTDPFARRCVRVSMGGIFDLPVVAAPDPADDVRWARRTHGLQAVATVVDHARVALPDYRRPERLAICFGNEANGLPPPLRDACDTTLTIPMAAGVDSLNLAMAAGITLYALTATLRREPGP